MQSIKAIRLMATIDDCVGLIMLGLARCRYINRLGGKNFGSSGLSAILFT